MDALRLPAKMEYLETFRSYVLEKAEKWGIDPETLFKIELVLEELLTNVIHYAYVDGDNGDVEVQCFLEDNIRFHLSIHDWGKPFDPLGREDPDLTKGVNDREIGGLGIHLVRQMADQVSYRREVNSNILNLYFQISTVCT
jgi:anti-sigma regulatory factor (Ser/Thr protein kinase)